MDMKPSRFTEEHIIGILREHEAGANTADVCRKHGVSSATFYKWKAKFGGLDISDAKRLRALEDRCATPGAPDPLPHRANRAQMLPGLYPSLDESWGSGHAPQAH
jgi:putative transposase